MHRPMSFSSIGGQNFRGQEDKSTAKFNLREKYASPVVKHEGTGGFPTSDIRAGTNGGIIIPKLTGINSAARLPSQTTDNLGFQQYGQQLETSERPLSSRSNKIFQDQQRPSSQSNIQKERLNSKGNGAFQDQNVNYNQQQEQSLFVPQGMNSSFNNNLQDRTQLAVQKPMLLIAQNQPKNLQLPGYSLAQNSNLIAQQRNLQQLEESRLFADDQLLKKAEAATQKLLESSQVLEIIVSKRRQIFGEYDACLDRIDAQKKRMHECSKKDSKKFFIQKTAHELMLFKDKKAELTRLKEECQRMLEKHEVLEANLRTSGIINPSSNKTTSQGQQPTMKDDFEFESEFLSLSDQCQQRMGIIQVAVENYKKFYRIDRTSNKFSEMQRQLLSVIQNFEETEKQLSTSMGELVKNFVEQLRGLKQEVEENSNFHDILLASFQESFDTVEQLLFYRQDKIQELKQRINNAIKRPLWQIFCNYQSLQQQSQLYTSNYGNFNQDTTIKNKSITNKSQYDPLNNNTNNNSHTTFISTFMKSLVGSATLTKLRVQLDKEIKDIDQIAHKIKKDAKSTHSSSHSMFFVQLRSKLISKVIQEINESILGTLSELSRVVDYSTGPQFANDLSCSNNIISNSEQLIIALTNHATTSIFQQQQTMQLLQQSQLTLSQLYELQNKLEQYLNEEQFKVIIGQIFQGILNDLEVVIAELNDKQSIVLPLIQYQAQMLSFVDKKQEIQSILSQSNQITTAFTSNPHFFLNFYHNYITLPDVLQVKIQLQESQVVLQELIEFCNNAKKTNLDQQLLSRDSNSIQAMFSSLLYNESNITVISNILEATICLAPQNVTSFNFKVNPDQSTLESTLPKKAEEVDKSLKELQTLKQKSLLGSEAESRLLSSVSNVERVIQGTQNILLTWIKSGESLVNEIQVIRKSGYPQSNIQDQLEQIMHISLQELNECINDEIADRDITVNELRNFHNNNGIDNNINHNGNQQNNDLPGILSNEMKSYSECIVRFALNLENKLLNPYSAKYLLSWLENHHDTAFEHISYLFDFSDLIKYSKKKTQPDEELDLQLKLLRSRITESIQSQSSILVLFNQNSLLADMQLELILEVVLEDSIIYDYQIFIELVVIGQHLNSAIRLANTLNQLFNQKQLCIPKNLHAAKQLLQSLTRYYRLLSRQQNQLTINPQVGNLMTAQLKQIISQQIVANHSTVISLLGLNSTNENIILQGVMQMQDMASNFVEMYQLTTEEFVQVTDTQSLLFSKIQKKLKGIEYILQDSFVGALKNNKYLPVPCKITQNIKLEMNIGLFERIIDLDKVFEYLKQESLLDWKNILEASLSTQPRAQIIHNIKKESLTDLQKTFISTYESINKLSL